MSYSIFGLVAILINFILNRKYLSPKKNTQEKPVHKSFRLFIYGIFAFLATDVCWGFLAALKCPLLLYIDTVIYFWTMFFTVLLWARYVVAYFNDHSNFGKILLVVGNILLMIEMLALVINHFYHFFFWIDEAGEYHAYFFRYLSLIIQIILFLTTSGYSFFRSSKNKDYLGKRRYSAIGVMGIVMSTAIIFQMVYPLLPIYAVGYLICTSVLHTYVIEDENEELRRRADEASKAKTAFLFNMSHDIRTPMNAITGFTERAIRHKDDPKSLSESLEKVKISSEYLLKIINDILDMAKIESGKLELKEELNYVEDGHKTLLEMFGGEAVRKVIGLQADFSIKDKYLWFDGDRTLQVIANLLSNAIKYTNPGGTITYKIKQLPSERTDYATFEITVSDTGIGMSKAFLERIFEPFEREQASTQSGAQGTGLGMSIVKKLCDAMDYEIKIDSEIQKGTTVTLITRHRIATTSEIEAFVKNGKTLGNEALHDLSGKRVLLVEDNELSREIGVDILEDEKLNVDTASDGTDAVRILKEKGPDYYDFILMDIQMPVMNGYEATRQIRGMYPDVHIPIIALSANAFEEDKEHSKEAGMDEHIAKPIKLEELFAVLAKY